MKKTLTINLGGSVFHIDEDAYQLLDKYLSNLRIHFKKEEGSDEIMNDFELRISELFSERIRLGYQVISIDLVEEVIKRMGKPEEIFDEEIHEEQEHVTNESNTQHTTRKRLMRDPDNKVLGGVAGGIAAYTGWDATAIRIILFLLMFYYGITIPIYLVLWLIIPQARTATEKLEMRGESVTIENIGKTVTDGFEKVSHNVNNYVNSEKPRNFFQKLGDIFVQVIGFILKFVVILAGIILLPGLLLAVLVMLVAIFALLVGGSSVLYHLSPFGMDWYLGAPSSLVIMGCIGCVLLFGVPLFYIGSAIATSLFHTKPLPATGKWTLIILWVISFILLGIYFYQTGINGWNSLDWSNANYYIL